VFFLRTNRTRNPHVSQISLKMTDDYFREAGLVMDLFESIYALRGPLIYFFEEFVLRFIFCRHKIFTFCNRYRSSGWFNLIGWIDAAVCKVFPQVGQAYIFDLRKS